MSATQAPASVNKSNNNDGSNASLTSGAGNADSGASKGEGAVSMPKGHLNAGQAAHISFGSMHGQNDSSGKAGLPSSPRAASTFVPGASTKFGTISASDKAKANESLSSGKADASTPTTPAPRSLDFNKLFQSGANASSAAKNGNNGASVAPSDGGSPSPASPSVGRGITAGRPSGNAGRPTTFEGFRNPSQSGHPASLQAHPSGQTPRLASGGAHPTASYNAGQVHQQQPNAQQPRSPHMPSQSSHMQHMPHLNGAAAQWQGQPQMYYPHMYPGSYNSYPGMPPQMPHMGQQWTAPQPGYDQAQPRSPRHLPASTSQAGNASGTPSLASATPGLSSPATSQRSVPHTPSSIASPPAHHLGMGLPQSRPPSFHAHSGQGYAAHSPSHSFSGNAMSASARQFEPAPFQKRVSSAIKIVDPNTKAAVEFKAPPKKDASAPGTPVPASAKPLAADATSGTPSAAESARSALNEATAQSNTPSGEPASPAPSGLRAAATSGSAAQALPTTPTPKPAASSALAPASPAASTFTPSTKLETSEDFMKRVKAKADEAKRLKEGKAAAEEAKRAEAAKAQAAADKPGEETKNDLVKADAPQAHDVTSKQKEGTESKDAERPNAEVTAAAGAAVSEKTEPQEGSADQRKTHEEHVDDSPAQGTDKSATIADEGTTAEGADDNSSQTPFKSSVADIERLAREASSVPSTPMEGTAPRLPPTPRTPGTPGFLANLPAKPVSTLNTNGASGSASGANSASSISNAINSNASNGIKLDSDALERRRKSTTPSQLDIPSAQSRSTSVDLTSAASTASAALGSARFIEDITKVSYPDKIQSPRPELNESAEPGKFRYDRDFLLQFMSFYKEKPSELPPLASIGMDGSQAAAGRGAGGRRASGMGPPAAPGRGGSIGLGLGSSGLGAKGGGMGQFSHPARTSEERFAASTARGGAGAFGSSGPMGSFNAGARSQPLSRTGSGSNAIPTREAMGSGIPSGGGRTSSRRGKDRRDPGRSGFNPPEKGGPTIPMDQVVPLANSENRWTGGRGQNIKADAPEMVTRKVKALLNKLTLEKFDSISTQILDWANKSVDEKDGETLRIVIALIFEKATDEAAWSEMYATLCRKIMEKLDPKIEDENIKTNDDKPVTGGHLFRKYLVNRCQEDFERGWAQRDATAAAAKSKEAEDNAKKAQNEKNAADAKEAEARGEKPGEEKDAAVLSDEYYEAQKAKRRGLGLVRFIGELFKFQMLSEKIMHLCIQRLLNNATTPEEEEIESLCKLLTTIGKLLEEGKGQNLMDKYFVRMDEMMSSAAMTARMRFMLQDVIELRQNHWKPRHDNAAPKTIAQIHEDAAKAKAQAENERISRMHSSGPMSRGGSRRGQQRDQYGPDGFITVGNQPAAPAHQTKAGNLSGFGKGIERSGASRPMNIGPQSFFARKNQKSDDGSNPPSRTASSQNIFSLLSSTNESSDPPQSEDARPSERPKLVLAKRTKPLADQAGGKAEGGEEDDDDDDEKADDEEQQADEADEDAEQEEDLSDEEAKRRIDNDIKEFLEIKNVEEGKLALENLPSSRRSDFINKIVETVLNRKEEDVKLVGQLLSTARESQLLDDEAVEAGLKDHVELLDDISIDVPNAYGFMASLLVSSGLPREKIEQLASTIQGEGVKPPKDRLLAKVDSL